MTRTPWLRFVAGSCLCACILLRPSLTSASTYRVDTTSDDGGLPLQACGEATPGDCSLRGAIIRANASIGADDISFDIPITDPGYVASTNHWRIAPATDLPSVSDDVVIDGSTQPGSQSNTLLPDEGGSNAVLKIELHGNGSGSSAGVTIVGGKLVLRGIAINRFQINLALYAPGPHRVEGCFIGTDISGMLALAANGNSYGIRLRGQAVIGGTLPAMRNVISGNGYIGIWDESATSTAQSSTFQGNLIGLGADGATALPGQDYGMYLNGAVQGELIGGASVEAGNLFGGNELSAIYITAGNGAAANAPPIRILGNVFGTDWSGMLARPNGAFPASPSQAQPTISVFRAGRCGVAIGGDAPHEGNLIANGAAAGVLIGNCTGAAIHGNSFRGNRIGIDISASSNADGATANDAGDADDGGNRLQNFPAIDSVAYSDGGNTITLTYRVNSAVANAAYPLRIDIARGFGGQALAPLLSDTYGGADAGQPRSVSFATDELMGQPLVLQATDADDNSSEFNGEGIFASDFEQ